MKYSFEGIGQWNATFACADVAEGLPVKAGGSGTAVTAAAGEDFMGLVVATARDGKACTVQLGGMATIAYTGTAPALGYTILVSNGAGGVKTASTGHARLVVDVNTTDKTVTFVL